MMMFNDILVPFIGGTLVSLIAVCTPARAMGAGLTVDHATIRMDQYPVPVDEWQWGEGWGDHRQYFPRYFRTAATHHVFLRNNSSTPVEIEKLLFNGKPIEEVCTTADYAGPVIWYRVNPEVIEPGQIGMVYVRLRDEPTKPIDIAVVTSDNGKVSARLGASKVERIRLGDVGFNKDISRVYVYVDKITKSALTVAGISIDGVDLTSRSTIINGSFKDGKAALIEVDLAQAFSYGSYHCIKVTTQEGPVAMHQVRARDDEYPLVIINGQTPLKEYYAKFFNFLYSLHGLHPTESGWWDKEDEIAKLGFGLIRQAPNEDVARAGATVPPGKIMYNNVDEPDAHEPEPLPYMDRCGINIMRQVEPVMKMQRRLDPHHETTVIVDRSYAPRNWLDYGEVPDVLINDIYTPTRWHGFDLGVLPVTIDSLKAAVGPRPVHVMLFGCMNTGHELKRSPTPEENDMSVHYVIGGGAKGLHYFLDWNSYPMVFEGGFYIGAPRTNMLWRTMGRMNAEISRMSRLLSVGHPFQVAKSGNEKLWVRSLLCGKDNIVVVLVNRKHNIPTELTFSGTVQPYVFPIKDCTVAIDLPEWFDMSKAVQVSWDGVKPVNLTGNGSNRQLKIDELRTSMVVVLSQDPKIEDKLVVDQAQMQALIESEKPIFVTDGPTIANSTRPNAAIKLDRQTVLKGTIVLDLTDPETLAKASLIRTEGELKLAPGTWLGLMTKPDWHGDSEIVLNIQSELPLIKITASLQSQTPNIAARAHNIVGISLDGSSYSELSSLDAAWNGGVSGERLVASVETAKGTAVRTFSVRVRMRDPGIVASDQATNLLEKLELTWEAERN